MPQSFLLVPLLPCQGPWLVTVHVISLLTSIQIAWAQNEAGDKAALLQLATGSSVWDNSTLPCAGKPCLASNHSHTDDSCTMAIIMHTLDEHYYGRIDRVTC